MPPVISFILSKTMNLINHSRQKLRTELKELEKNTTSTLEEKAAVEDQLNELNLCVENLQQLFSQIEDCIGDLEMLPDSVNGFDSGQSIEELQQEIIKLFTNLGY